MKSRYKLSGGIWPYLAVGTIVSLTFWLPHLDSFNVSKFVVLGIGVLALTISGLIQGQNKNRFGISECALVTFILLLFINFAASPNHYKTLLGASGRNNGVLTYLFLAILAYVVSQKFQIQELPKLLWALTILGIIQTGYNTLQLAKLDPIQWNNPYGFILGTLGNSDFAAALLAICAVATMWLINLKQNNKVLGISLGFLVFVELIVMYKSNVRQSLVLFIFGFSVIVYFEITKRNKILGVIWISLTSLTGVLAVLGSFKVGPLSQIVYKESISYRGDYWRAAWRMFKDNPIFGVGLGNYGDYFNRYRDALQVSRRGPELGSDVAHSLPLDFLAMGGLMLGFAYLLLIGLSIYLILRKISQSTEDEKRLGFVAFSLLGCYLLQSIISIDQIGLAVWGWIFIGIALSFNKGQLKPHKFSERFFQIFMSFGALITFLGLVFVAIPTWQANVGLKQLASIPYEQKGINTGALRLELAKKIVEIVPHDSQFKTQVAMYLLSNNQAEGIDFAKSAINQNPSDSTARLYLVIAYERLNDLSNLAKTKAQALKIDPFNPNLK